LISLKEALEALLFIAPAYGANMAPLLLVKLVKRRHPLDFGYRLFDGKRVLGDSKSFEGSMVGIASGFLIGLIIGRPLLGFTLGLGSMIGDSAGSFIKRRLGIEPGGLLPLIDQLSFFIGALTLAYLVGFGSELSISKVFFLLLLTPVLHVFSNALAFKLGLKSKPY